VLGVGVRLQLQVVLAWLVATAEAAEGGCEWLHRYCYFLQRRHRLGSRASDWMRFSPLAPARAPGCNTQYCSS
jgi:hypothetical protein